MLSEELGLATTGAYLGRTEHVEPNPADHNHIPNNKPMCLFSIDFCAEVSPEHSAPVAGPVCPSGLPPGCDRSACG